MRYSSSVLLCLSLAATAYGAGNDPGLGRLGSAMRKSSKSIAGKLSGKVCVMDFTPLGKENQYTSELGITISDLLTTHLLSRSKNAFGIISRKELVRIMGDSIIFGDKPDLANELVRKAGMDVLVTGTYDLVGNKIAIDVRAISAKEGILLSSKRVEIKHSPVLEKMMAHTVRLSPVVSGGQDTDEIPKEQVVLSLDAEVYYEGGDGKLYPLRDGMVLTSKDNYSVYLKPEQTCYVYVYQIDSTGKVFRLFPNSSFGNESNPLEAKRHYWIPDRHENGRVTFLFLDESAGTEEIYVMATTSRMDEFEKITDLDVARFSQVIKEHESRGAIRMMGVSGTRVLNQITQVTTAEGSMLDMYGKKLVATGGFYYKLSFIHQ
jgi:TolB-like protein